MVAATVLALVLANPVGGDVTARFDVAANPFQGGQHRGVDLAAPPGASVEAACSGRVVVAGRVGSSGRLVTVRCGRWRVTHMPLAQVEVRAGDVIARGTRLGTAGASDDHAGLHLGVRREDRRFGYVDPLRFFTRAPLPPPTVRPPAAPRRPPPARPAPAPRVKPVRPLRAEPPPRAEPARRADPAPVPALRAAPAPRAGLAPWPAWAGLALVLAGAGFRIRGRRGRGRRWAGVVVRRPVR